MPTYSENSDNDNNPWLTSEIWYLQQISTTCEELSNRYMRLFHMYRRKRMHYKLPVIILGSLIGLTAFGSGQFSESARAPINITVGVVNILISIISSIEAFLKLEEYMSGSLTASQSYQKLKEKIDIELTISKERRRSIVFVRECYSEYMKINEIAPPILSQNTYILVEYEKIPHYNIINRLFTKQKFKSQQLNIPRYIEDYDRIHSTVREEARPSEECHSLDIRNQNSDKKQSDEDRTTNRQATEAFHNLQNTFIQREEQRRSNETKHDIENPPDAIHPRPIEQTVVSSFAVFDNPDKQDENVDAKN